MKLVPSSVKPEALVTAKASRGCSDSFLDLLGRFRSDEKGEICHSDNVIKTVGEFLWGKKLRRNQLMTATMS